MRLFCCLSLCLAAIAVSRGTGWPAEEAGPPASAAAVRLLDAMEDPNLYSPGQPELGHKWTGRVSLETRDFKEGRGCLRFDISSAKTGEESYPQWARALDPQKNDWRGYKALRYWVKVVSARKEVTYKNICIVVYNGESPKQQFIVHRVPVGQWVQLADNIMDYERDRVRGIVIYLYETNPSWQDDYSWWIDGLELVPAPEGAINFDGFALAPRQEPTRPARFFLRSRRLALAFDDRGRIVELRSDGRPLYHAPAQAAAYTGLLIRDWRRGEELTPVSGGLRQAGGTLVQEASPLPGLKITARVQSMPESSPPRRDWLRADIIVQDKQPADRPLTLYFALPVAAVGWQWHDDIAHARPIGKHGEYIANPSSCREPRVSPYPYCLLSDKQTAIGLVTPLEPPRLQRMFYNAELGVLCLAYNFCLTPAATKQRQTATFSFYIAPADPAWGFRALTADYYKAFPEYFIKRVPKEGGWGCWGTYAANPHIPELGFVFHWGPDPRGGAPDPAAAIRYDNAHGYLSLPYIEWTNMHVSMEQYETAGPEDILRQVRYIADPQRKEPLPRYRYCFPYEAQTMGPDYDGFMRAAFQAYLKSLLFTPAGWLYGEADKSEFGLLAAKYIPFNADPDIPGGAGAFFLNVVWPRLEQYYQAHGARPDGFGWDNFYVRGTALDYRREHFAYADLPLTFDPQRLQPALMKDFCTYELQRVVAARLRAQGRLLMANQGVISPCAATLPLIDIFGYEWNIEHTATYARTLASHKPVCSLPVKAEHYRDPFVREHLLYGFWPGGYFDTKDPEYLALL